jgi:multidrug efflux pump subunit AcrB
MPVLGTTVLGKSRGILSYFTRHRTVANLLLVVMVVLGLVALPKMRTQFFPDIVINNITVNVNWAGAGAEDVDAAILQVLNPVLLLVKGVSDTHAHAREGAALLVLEFEPRWNMGRAANEVQAAVDAVTTLPQDAEAPVIKRGAWRDRVTDVIITGPVGVDQLGRFADEFIARLFADGITRAPIRGIAPAEILVEVTPKSLMKHGISMLEISRAIGQEAIADPAGDVAGANLRVRTGVAKRSAADIARLCCAACRRMCALI